MNNGPVVMNGALGVLHASDILTEPSDAPIVPPVERRPSIPPALLFGIATAFGLSSTGQAYIKESLGNMKLEPHAIWHLLILNFTYWYIPALLAPAIMAFAVRHPLGRKDWPQKLPLHVVCALSYSIFHTVVMMGLRYVMIGRETLARPESGWWVSTLREYFGQLDWLLTTYLALCGVAYALAFRRESESRALNSAQLETRLVEAQLQSLQRQLHPHFLFNTLNTISGLLRTDPDGADAMIDRLGDLLRMTLHKSGIQEVPLKEELDVLQKYVEIEQTRLGNRLKFETQVQPEVLDAQVPSLVLQTLVENAIRHGIAPNTRPGFIVVTAAREGEELVLQIRDTGDGLPPDRLMALNRGVGLDNTRARLEHLYRGKYAFTFANLERGLCVTIRIPLQVDTPSDIEAGAA